ncbi:MAG TPA: SRPBCC family protein [Euzebyales bacterium]|nr:SRPBCC family protein [Euzebyales bacterium]
MELNHSFTVPVGADTAFDVLTDIERIAPCMPGASVDSVDGDEFTGRVKVKVGPMQVTYRGKARYAEVDQDNHSAVIEARAQEMRGSGTANATISAKLDEKGDEETEVTVVSNLSITGRPAQFGRGVMNEVGSKLLNQFADCLSTKLSGAEEPEEAVEAAAETTTTAAAGSNGDSAATSEQEITQQVGAASPQPATDATTAAATAAPSAAAAPSGAAAGSSAASSSSGTQAADRATTPTQTSAPDVEAIDLFEVAGASVAKRAIPVLAALLLIVLLIWRRRR